MVGLDLRGHGDSDSPEGDYGMEILAEDVAWLCGQLGIAGAVVLGHSMGGAVGVELVARHPALASALVLVDSPMSAWPEARAMLSGHLELLRGPRAAKARRAGIEMMFVADMLRARDHVAAACIQGLLEWDGPALVRPAGVNSRQQAGSRNGQRSPSRSPSKYQCHRPGQ